ncbi:restriction endonuclease subunit S [Cellulomonas oligotrophica]|uniref:Type I restriction enzyme S subunit n=1 Tax=Cellulomonas oligotrophica TaxID=931536 RepID=A0A7Y9FED0_9CELL|nr:restriction endonuclease subunit S [Cellulomonas oligotrophica]NYD85750.1 type I restriction enzyme S subunit [Cellulomonas oligotrophica]
MDVLDGRRVPVNAAERARRPGHVPYYGAAGQVGWIDLPLFDEDLLLLGEDGVQFFDPAKSKAYRISGPSWVNNHAHVLRARRAVDLRYLEHYLNWFDYRGFANGTTRLKLTQAAMKRIPVMLPEIEEQRQIVDILEDHLSRLDAANAYLDAAQRRVTSLEKSILREGIECTPDRVALGRLIARVEAGRSFGGSAPPADPSEWGVVKVSAMTWGEFRQGENKAVPAERADPRFEIKQGDLLVSRANTSAYVGASVLVGETRRRLLLSDKSLRLVPHPGVDAEWLHLALSAPSARKQISDHATGTKDSMRNISQASLLAVEVPNISLDEQLAQVKHVRAAQSAVNRLSSEVRTSAARTQTARRSLLAAAFSGRLTGRSSDLDHTGELVFS